MLKQFASDHEVPESCPPELLLPNNGLTHLLAIPQDDGTVSPIELSWILFEGNASYAGLHLVKSNLEASVQLGTTKDVHDKIHHCDYLNHVFRIIARIALDPRRYDLFDLTKAYKLDRGIQYPAAHDLDYLKHFAFTHGVVERGLQE